MIDIRKVDPVKLQKNARVVSLIVIGTFIGLFIYFMIFPIQIAEGSVTNTTNNETVLKIDPLALTLFKEWNNLNQEVQSVPVDACNNAERIDSTTWKITLNNC